jgi:hypothetical protein
MEVQSKNGRENVIYRFFKAGCVFLTQQGMDVNEFGDIQGKLQRPQCGQVKF